ncbi:MAG TPA: substrate-binding domain-containing protein [Ilumatobacter sp.]|nr:substrate-binding domain-containing protein [Ilumatobacter sp.]
MRISSKRLIATAVTATLALAACGGGDDTTDAPGGDADGGPASSSVFVSGSSTVEPISIRVAELAATTAGGALAVTVEGPGTGDGFKKFCAGESDISDASRRIKDSEAEACAEAGIDYVELEIAIDGLSVLTNPTNAAVECLDVAALYALIGPESEGFESWSDANALAAEIGSTSGPFPDAPLSIYGPGEESGTYDTFVEFAIADLAEQRGAGEYSRADYSSSGNDNFIIEGIEGSDTSLGWVGYAYYTAEQDRLQAIAIDTGDGCVMPTDDTIASGEYGFSRSLFIYVNTDKAAANPALAAYVDLYLSEAGLAAVAEAGYVDLPADRMSATQAAWAAAL